MGAFSTRVILKMHHGDIFDHINVPDEDNKYRTSVRSTSFVIQIYDSWTALGV